MNDIKLLNGSFINYLQGKIPVRCDEGCFLSFLSLCYRCDKSHKNIGIFLYSSKSFSFFMHLFAVFYGFYDGNFAANLSVVSLFLLFLLGNLLFWCILGVIGYN